MTFIERDIAMQNYYRTTKSTFFVTLSLLSVSLLGCTAAKTAGTHNEDLSEKGPYVFTYDGKPEEAVSSLKKNLLPKGFSVVNEDEFEGGGSYVFDKTLADDEKFETTAFFEYMTGTSTGTQKGRLVFVVSRTDGNITVRMTPRLVATTQQYSKYNSSSEAEEAQVKQGHPLPMKYGRMLVQIDGWKLKDPPRAEVFMNERSTAGPESRAETPDKNQGKSNTGQKEPRKSPKYGIGFQWAAPAFGVSGTYDFTNRITGQAVLGFIGGLQTYAARGLYRFKRKEALSLYGYGTIGAWRYSGALTSSSALGLGGGVGVEYGWGQIYGNLELGFVGLDGELAGYNDSFSSVTYGIGLHYKFGK
ncbi:MAG: hypothetical protein ABEL51_07345 [Salinibacter sp.]